MALALLLPLLLAVGAYGSLLTPEKREYCAVMVGSLAPCTGPGELGQLTALGVAACCEGAAELHEMGCFQCDTNPLTWLVVVCLFLCRLCYWYGCSGWGGEGVEGQLGRVRWGLNRLALQCARDIQAEVSLRSTSLQVSTHIRIHHCKINMLLMCYCAGWDH